MPEIRALTVWQPWAWCIAAAGKDLENRTWWPQWHAGQRIAIHAGLGYDPDAARALPDMLAAMGSRVKVPRSYVFGAVVAVAMLGDAPLSGDVASPWFFGPLGWPLRDVRPVPTPVPCSGAQGLWRLPPDVLERLTLQGVLR